jgi:hypothetical protein
MVVLVGFSASFKFYHLNFYFGWQLLQTSFGIMQGISIPMPCTGRVFPSLMGIT